MWQLLADDREFLKATVDEALEDVLEAEMKEGLGAAKGEHRATAKATRSSTHGSRRPAYVYRRF